MTNNPIPFSHLHTHTPEGSLLDGFMHIDKAIAQAKAWGMDALAVTDHGTMAAHEKFYGQCKAEGIHPVLGMEAYLTPNKAFKKADFEAFTFIEDANGAYTYAFLTEEEATMPGTSWTKVEELKPKAFAKEMTEAAREPYLFPLLEKSLPAGGVLPTKKPTLTRMVNAYIKTKNAEGKYLYIEADTVNRDYFEWFPRSGHLLLLAKNNEGYQNLLRLNAIGQLEGFYSKPRIDFEDIKKYGKGIIATTACLGSITSRLIMNGRLTEAKQEIQRLVDCFDEVYLEIQPSKQKDQWVVNDQMIAWSKELNLPLVATSDVHMVSHDDLTIHELFMNIGKKGNKESDEEDDDISVYDSAYFMHPQEMLDNGIPMEALQNAYDLSHKCQVDFLEDKATKFPEYEVPKGYTFDSYLYKLAHEGLFDLFFRKTYIKDYTQYQQRLDYELETIAMKGLSAYFVIVWDYVNFARSKDIFVGPGRGSGAGSLVLYAIGITNIDPIKYDLLFERMLNRERPGNPDVDEDFDYLRRGEVIDYITQKYGADNVAQIGTYGTLSTKTVLKDVGRLLDIDHHKINTLNKEIPSHNGKVMELSEALEEIPAVKLAQEKYPELFELALQIQSMPRGAGIHPCFDENTLIATDEGLKRIVEVAVGDKVLTHKQRYRPVTELMVHPSEDIYNLSTVAGYGVYVTGNHPFYVKRITEDTTDSRMVTPEWVPADQLLNDDYHIGIPLNGNKHQFPEQIGVFRERNWLWVKVRKLTKTKLKLPMYNLTVLDDSSYVANGMAVHNCGLEISPVTLNDHIPLMRSKDNTSVTMYEGPVLENLGYVKFDILGLKNLSVLRISTDLIMQRHGVLIDINNIEPEDKDVFAMIQKGDTQGLFQLEFSVALIAA